jgi:hypothetical protein
MYNSSVDDFLVFTLDETFTAFLGMLGLPFVINSSS